MNRVFQFRTIYRSVSIKSGLTILGSFLILSCSPDAQNRPSPLRSDSTNIRGVEAYIEFSSPAVRERKIFGDGSDFLVPFGELWRTGANNATFISVSSDMMIDSLKLDSGSYSLFTIPNKDEWTVIFNHEWKQWGSYNYKDSLDAVRLIVKPRIVDQSQERLLFYFADDSLKFRWDKVRWAIPIIPSP